MNVLVIEDERKIAFAVRSSLEAEGFNCTVAYDGEDGLRQFKQHQPEVVVLDLELPNIDGLEVCSQIRQSKTQKDPFIVMLTARGTEVDRIIGYSTGADDYIPKPFNTKELTVRVRAVTRRASRRQQPQQSHIETPHFLIDREKREVLVEKREDGEIEEVHLTTLEFELLFLMASRPGRVWERAELLETISGIDYAGEDRAIDTYIGRLRMKISPGKQRDRFIKTVTSVGYKFEDK